MEAVAQWRTRLVFVFVSFFVLCGAQQPQFQLSVPPSDLRVDSNGTVFVAAGNELFRLDGDFVEQESLELDEGTSIQRIALSQDESRVVVCHTGPISFPFEPACRVYDASNFGAGTQLMRVDATARVEDIALFTSPGDSFYAGSYGTAVGLTNLIYFVQHDFGGSEFSRVVTSIYNGNQVSLLRRFYGGFVLGSNAYYVVYDGNPSSVRGIRVLRVCDIDQCPGGAGLCDITALYEAELVCGSSFGPGTAICGVSLLSNFDGTPGDRLVVSLCEPFRNRICSFDLSVVDSAMDSIYDSCVNDPNPAGTVSPVWSSPVSCSEFTAINNCAGFSNPPALSTPSIGGTLHVDLLNTVDGITSTLALTVDGSTLLYVGYTDRTDTSRHFVGRYHITSASINLRLGDMTVVAETTSAVRHLQWVEGLEYIYVATEGEVFRIPLEQCSTFEDCQSCAGDSNPLCGWCTVENKCSRSSECRNSSQPMRWVQEATLCIASMVDPATFVLDNPQNITVTVTPGLPPPLERESYECYFETAGGLSFLTEAVESVTNTQYVCDLTPGMIPPFQGTNLVTDFSFRSTAIGIPFATEEDAVTVYDCSAASSCSECLQTQNACGWCIFNKQCSGTSDPCLNSNEAFFLSPVDGQTFVDVCPLLERGLFSGEYVQPVAIERNLTLITSNLPEPIMGFSYACMIGNVILSAEYINATTFICIVQGNQLQLPAGDSDGRGRAPVRIVWQSDDGRIMHNIDTRNGAPINALLYNCNGVASSCSACLVSSNGTGLECAWFNPSDSCIIDTTPGVITDRQQCPRVPAQVQNVRVFVYFPIRGDSSMVTALVVWDGLSPVDAGGTVDSYFVRVFDTSSGVDVPDLSQNGDARTQYSIEGREDGFSAINTFNRLFYPLQAGTTYGVEVLASNSVGEGPPSATVTFTPTVATPPQQVFAASSSGGGVVGDGAPPTLEVTTPLTVNTINRTVYWYSADQAALMQQSLDGGEPELLGQPPPGITGLAVAYDWVGETVYFIARLGEPGGTLTLWRVAVINPAGLELVFEDEGVSLSAVAEVRLAVDPFRGFVYWTLQDGPATSVHQLDLRDPTSSETLTTTERRKRRKRHTLATLTLTSALTLEPTNGRLWVCDAVTGDILSCDPTTGDCIPEVDASNLMSGGMPVALADAGLPATSIALDETRIYWAGAGTPGIFFVSHRDTTDLMMLSGTNVSTVLTLSPGLQPLPRIECLAPDTASPASRPQATLVNATNTTLTISWTAPALPAGCSDEVFSFAPLKYDVLPETGTSVIVPGYPQSTFDTTFVMTGLQPFIVYCAELRAENQFSVRNNPFENGFGFPVELQTLEGVPDPPVNVQTVMIGTRNIHISWDEPLFGPGIDDLINTLRGNNPEYLVRVDGDLTINTIVTEVNLTADDGLQPGTLHSIEVFISNGVLISPATVVNASTWPLPPQPVFVSDFNLVNSSITVAVTLNDEHEPIEMIRMEATQITSGSPMTIATPAQTVNSLPDTFTFDISGLEADTRYNVVAVGTYRTVPGLVDDPEMTPGDALIVGFEVLDLSFTGDSPQLGVGTVNAELFTNRPGVQIMCFLHRTTFSQDCSNGSVIFTNVPTGGYSLRVVATDGETGDTAEIRTGVFVPASDAFCSVNAINQLVTVSGSTASAEFSSTGNPTGFLCRVDQQSFFPCTSPVTVTGLEFGRHRIRVRPTGCGRPRSGRRSFSVQFDI